MAGRRASRRLGFVVDIDQGLLDGVGVVDSKIAFGNQI
jgi:hypothetical protein